MASPPRVSVLLPARNAAETLPAALATICRQSLDDFECVVVDDGSTDATASVVETAARADPRIRMVIGRGAGIVSALNVGLEQCRGEFVARMDADDLSHKHRLALQVQGLDARPAIAALGCHVRLFPTRALSNGMRNYEAWLCSIRDSEGLARDAFIECPVAHPSLMVRSIVLRRFGYADRGWPEDYDLVLRMLADGLRVSVLPERLLYWRESAERLSRTSPSCGQDRIVACKAHYLSRGFLSAGERYVLWGYGDTGKELCAALSSHGKHPSLIVELHPGRIGQRIRGVPVVTPDALARRRAEPIIASVAGASPRGQIRAALLGWGYREGVDFVCAA